MYNYQIKNVRASKLKCKSIKLKYTKISNHFKSLFHDQKLSHVRSILIACKVFKHIAFKYFELFAIVEKN